MKHYHPPLLKDLLLEIKRQGKSYQDVSTVIGCHKATIAKWSCGTRRPLLINIEAAWNVLGYRLVTVKEISK